MVLPRVINPQAYLEESSHPVMGAATGPQEEWRDFYNILDSQYKNIHRLRLEILFSEYTSKRQ